MGIDNVINKLYMFKRLKDEVNNEIEINLDKMEMDEIEKFELMHKIKKLDLIIDNVIKELERDEKKEEQKKQEHIASIDKEELVNKFKKEEVLSDIDIKQYVPIREEKRSENKNSIKMEKEIISEDKKENNEIKSSIELAYKRIEDLEKLLNERKLIEKEEIFGNMKNVHSKEEREEMLKKRHIISESFTPKAKEQSDPEMDKTVAMGKEEFYKEINESLEIEKKPQVEQVNIDHTMLMDKTEIEKQSKTNEENYEIDKEQNEDEYYDIYDEEKSSGILEKFKDLLGK
ncbi:MAG: hypothetical protein ACRDCW_08505 [Sarcina sp.]